MQFQRRKTWKQTNTRLESNSLIHHDPSYIIILWSWTQAAKKKHIDLRHMLQYYIVFINTTQALKPESLCNKHHIQRFRRTWLVFNYIMSGSTLFSSACVVKDLYLPLPCTRTFFGLPFCNTIWSRCLVAEWFTLSTKILRLVYNGLQQSRLLKADDTTNRATAWWNHVVIKLNNNMEVMFHVRRSVRLITSEVLYLCVNEHEFGRPNWIVIWTSKVPKVVPRTPSLPQPQAKHTKLNGFLWNVLQVTSCC